MKWFLLSILILSIYPCDDMVLIKPIGNCSKIEINNHDEGNQKTEHCSPFCFCNCCQVKIITFEITFFSQEKIIFSLFSKKEHYFSQPFNPKSNANNIWQPPKV
ncbi:MAG: DUF6660 family protein [Solirubrobacteraceae bacterium]